VLGSPLRITLAVIRSPRVALLPHDLIALTLGHRSRAVLHSE
jgi:hypothetical protein